MFESCPDTRVLNWDPERQRSYQPLSSLEVHSWKQTGGFPTTGQAFSSMRKPLLCLWPLDDGQLECLERLLKTPSPALYLLLLRFRASVTLARELVRGIGCDGMEAILPFGFMGMSPSHDKASIPIPGSSVEDTTPAGTKCPPPSRSGKHKDRSTHTGKH